MRPIVLLAMLVALAAPASAQAPSSATARPAAGAPHAQLQPLSSSSAAADQTPAVATGGPGKVDINGATAKQLEALPSIGTARAASIIRSRPYGALQELVDKKVLTQSVLDRAKGQMALANINTSTAKEMARSLPGIGEVRAKAIVDGRPYATAQDLVKKSVLTQGQFDGIKDLVTY